MATTTTRPLKIVLLGTSGQVGRELLGPLAACGDLVAWDRRLADFEQPATVVELLRKERPQVIVNAAAYTAVDRAEAEPDRARLVNATTVGMIAAEAARQQATLVHYSTDYVFDGTKAGCYVETSWHGFATRVLEAARDGGLGLRAGPEQVRPIPTSDYPLPAQRPANSRLCTTKLEAALGKKLPGWQDEVPSIVATLVAESPS
jgi:dTDP-4-dehydrorhamnose reductase